MSTKGHTVGVSGRLGYDLTMSLTSSSSRDNRRDRERRHDTDSEALDHGQCSTSTSTRDSDDDRNAWMGFGKMFVAGGVAGATARTCSAPLDRVKLLFQVQAVASSGIGSFDASTNKKSTSSGRPVNAASYTGVAQSLRKIYTEEGLLAFWKGNFTNVVRIVPYSACQLMANDMYKRLLSGQGEGGRETTTKDLTVATRLTAGALAGMTASAATHPLDTVRLRLAMPKHPYTGLGNALTSIVKQEGVSALYKGLGPTLVGIAPYAALNFAAYDSAKVYVYTHVYTSKNEADDGETKQNPLINLVLGALTGCFAATCCYPLDTVRRRMQMKGRAYEGQMDALRTIWRMEGYRGFYLGWAANTLKVVPQNSIRFVSYELMKQCLGIHKRSTDT